MKLLSLTLSALIIIAPVALAQTTHSMDHSHMNMSDEDMEGAVHTKAVLNSMGDAMANVTHEPIPEIGWPAMTMDLALSPDVHMMGEFSEGDTITLMLIKGEDGMYMIGGMMAE